MLVFYRGATYSRGVMVVICLATAMASRACLTLGSHILLIELGHAFSRSANASPFLDTLLLHAAESTLCSACCPADIEASPYMSLPDQRVIA